MNLFTTTRVRSAPDEWHTRQGYTQERTVPYTLPFTPQARRALVDALTKADGFTASTKPDTVVLLCDAIRVERVSSSRVRVALLRGEVPMVQFESDLATGDTFTLTGVRALVDVTLTPV